MSNDDLPHDLAEFLYQKLASLHANARLVFVFDPPGRLALAAELTAGGRAWRVVRYDGNDLALRAALARRPVSNDPLLIWVTGRQGAGQGIPSSIHISSLADLWLRADGWFDLSLTGVLKELIPGVHWPVEALECYVEILANRLPAVIQGYHQLRPYLDPGAALDLHIVRTLALHGLQPDTPIHDFLFARDTPGQVLNRYIRLAWSNRWDAAGYDLLRDHARLSPQVKLESIAAWFDAPLESLACYLYLRRMLARQRVSHIANHLRGLGILSLDPELLEPWVDEVMMRWERDTGPGLRN